MLTRTITKLWAVGSLILTFAYSAQATIIPAKSCEGFKTYTCSGWGSSCTGNNPGVYLQSNFALAFPNGIDIGCTNKLKFTTAAAVRVYLSQCNGLLGSLLTPCLLPAGCKTNPTNGGGSFGCELLALAINLKMDLAIPTFAPSGAHLQDLLIAGGCFDNWTVGKLFDEASKKIGGCTCSNPLITTVQFCAAIKLVNESYNCGNVVGNFLACPILCASGTVTPVSCKNGNNGSINLTVSGGVPPYCFKWNDNVTTQNRTGLCAGNYSVTVKDALLQSRCLNFCVTQPSSSIALSGTVTQATSCATCNGSATVTASGGCPPYTYSWSNGASGSATVSGLCFASNLVVTVTDSKGCSKTYTFPAITLKEGCAAATVINSSQGTRYDFTPVEANRSVKSSMLGTPENTDVTGTFYALGFGGWAILKVDGSIIDKPGNDVRVVEATWHDWHCGTYTERARVEVSKDMVTWYDKGIICQDADFDIAPLSCISYVRITDVSNRSDFVTAVPIADGFDVDGIICLQPSTGNTRIATGANPALIPDEEKPDYIHPKSCRIFPNPAEGRLNVSLTGFSEGEVLQLQVFDHMGREVKNLSFIPAGPAHNEVMNTEGLAPGFYVVQVKGEEINYSQKIVKK